MVLKQKLYTDLLIDDVELSIDFEYIPSTPDVWYLANGDPGYPGDPAEVDILKVSLWGIEIPLKSIPDNIFEYLQEKLIENAESGQYEPDGDY